MQHSQTIHVHHKIDLESFPYNAYATYILCMEWVSKKFMLGAAPEPVYSSQRMVRVGRQNHSCAGCSSAAVGHLR